MARGLAAPYRLPALPPGRLGASTTLLFFFTEPRVPRNTKRNLANLQATKQGTPCCTTGEASLRHPCRPQVIASILFLSCRSPSQPVWMAVALHLDAALRRGLGESALLLSVSSLTSPVRGGTLAETCVQNAYRTPRGAVPCVRHNPEPSE